MPVLQATGKDKKDNGQDEQGRTRAGQQGRTRAGRARKVNGQDGQG